MGESLQVQMEGMHEHELPQSHLLENKKAQNISLGTHPLHLWRFYSCKSKEKKKCGKLNQVCTEYLSHLLSYSPTREHPNQQASKSQRGCRLSTLRETSEAPWLKRLFAKNIQKRSLSLPCFTLSSVMGSRSALTLRQGNWLEMIDHKHTSQGWCSARQTANWGFHSDWLMFVMCTGM